MTLIRPFHRSDRDQLAALVNAHIAAVVPAASVSTSQLLAVLERDPGEFIVDPWVIERRTLVAEERDRVVAAAHLLRYADGPEVGDAYRGAAEIRWLVFWPEASYWPDARQSAERLLAACEQVLTAWRAATWSVDGTLPAPGVYGVPDAWPHLRQLYEAAGYRPAERSEVVLLADVAELASGPAPSEGVTWERRLGVNGTRFTASSRDDESSLGYIEVDTNLTGAERSGRGAWSDVGNLEFPADRPEVATWLHTEAARWLRAGGVRSLLSYADSDAEVDLLVGLGFRVLTRTVRGYDRREPVDLGGPAPE